MFKLKNINQVITAFLAAGGLGYINYWILEKLEVTSSGDGEKTAHITFSSLLCSIPDFFIYLGVKWGVKWVLNLFKTKNFALNKDVTNFIALIFTMLIIILITALFGKKIVRGIYWILRIVTTGNGKTGVAPGEPWTLIDKTGKSLIYLYNLNREPIAYGYGESFSGSPDSNYSINLQPVQKEYGEQLSYEDVVSFVYFDNGSPIEDMRCIKSHIHVNLKQGFIMVIFKVEETKEK